jgi:endoglycosylceramidase
MMRAFWKSKTSDHRLRLEADGFHDNQGRFIQFRGVNVAGNAKLPPFIPFEDSAWWDMLANWGFNMVRLTLFWEAIEPEPGQFCNSYLNKVKLMTDEAARRGIYVLLDMHQDLYSRWLQGDGAPDWAFPIDIDPKKNDGFGGRFWGLAYILLKDVRSCFTNFFSSRDLRDHYLNSWLKIAEAVKNNPYILGYDIMNEPSAGNASNLQGQFENGLLKSFYEEIIIAIRDVHEDAVGFVEPNVHDMFSSKFTKFNIDNLVYAPHLYNLLAQTLRFNPLPEDIPFNITLYIHKRKAMQLEIPLFIGEFGSPWTMRPSRNKAINDAMEALENSFVNNAYWDFSVDNVASWNEENFSLIDNSSQPRGLEVNIRPYIRSLCGEPIFQKFEASSKVFTTRFRCEPVAPPAIIYIPESVQYQEGFNINVSDGSFEYHAETGELYYFAANNYHHIIIKPPRGNT